MPQHASINVQGLLRELLHAVGTDTAKRRATLAALGSSLGGKGRHEDAAVAFAAAGDLRAAATQYQSAGEWEMALALAGVLQCLSCCVTGMAGKLIWNLAEAATLRRGLSLRHSASQNQESPMHALTC